MSQQVGSEKRRNGKKEGKKWERRKEKEGGKERNLISLYFLILFIQIYPYTIQKFAGMIDEIMIIVTLRVSRKI